MLVAYCRLCRHCRNLAEGGCLLSRFHFTRCLYFLGHVACWNLPWQGLMLYTATLAYMEVPPNTSQWITFSPNDSLSDCINCQCTDLVHYPYPVWEEFQAELAEFKGSWILSEWGANELHVSTTYPRHTRVWSQKWWRIKILMIVLLNQIQ